MRLTFDAEVEAFRAEFAAWLDAHAPGPEETEQRSRSSADVPAWARRWQRALFDDGWLLPANPPEYGGRNATLLQQFVHLEELSRRRIYHSYNPQGLNIVAPSILTFGTEEQKQRWAVPIMRAEITASLGMSEPNAGSDLAGLRTRAVLDGDHFVVNGQKVWTSGAHDADLLLAFVRTDADAPKHKGISALIVPTDLPGITRRPFGSIQSPQHLDFNEVFFDDVLVPVDNLVGGLNDGWRVANGSLGHERAMLWVGYAERLDGAIEDFRRQVRGTASAQDALMRDWLATLAIDAQALRLLGYRTLAKTARGMVPAEQSILKLFGSEAVQRGLGRIVEFLGPEALDQESATAPFIPLGLDALSAAWIDRYLTSFSGTIAGGTSEIQRNIIAERILGLPR